MKLKLSILLVLLSFVYGIYLHAETTYSPYLINFKDRVVNTFSSKTQHPLQEVQQAGKASREHVVSKDHQQRFTEQVMAGAIEQEGLPDCMFNNATENAVFQGSSAEAGLGVFISIDGNVAVVGAAGEESSRGAAYVYRKINGQWQQEARLTAADGQASDQFGSSVAISGNVMVIGAYSDYDADGNSSGAAYVYEYNGSDWIQTIKLRKKNAYRVFRFGSSVAVSGNRIAVGVPGDASITSDAGSVYTFHKTAEGWEEQAKVTVPTPLPYTQFGASIALSDTILVVGTRTDTWSKGHAYVYHFSNNSWQFSKELLGSNVSTGDRFGASVSVSGATIVVGAPGDDDDLVNTTANRDIGSAYVFGFDGNQWNEQAKLVASDWAGGASFGNAVSVQKGAVLVGAALESSNRTNAGAAYLFRYIDEKWTQWDKFTESTANSAMYGRAVALSPDNILVGTGFNSLNPKGSVFFLGCSTENAIPVITSGQVFRVSTNAAAGTSLGYIKAADAESDSLKNWSITAGNGLGYFTVSETGELLLLKPYIVDAATPTGFALTLRVEDAVGNNSREETVIITNAIISDVGEEQCTDNYPVLKSHYQEQELVDSGFGVSVAVDGNLAVVGAPGENSGTGAVYIYQYNGSIWERQTRIARSAGNSTDLYGSVVAISGLTVVIGAHGEENRKGAAYVYQYTNGQWTEQAVLRAADRVERVNFGARLAISGATIVVGAAGDSQRASQAGAAYIFEYNGSEWQQQSKLFAHDATAASYFGSDVGIWGSKIVVGAYGTLVDLSFQAGAAYVFSKNNAVWQQEAKLISAAPMMNDNFGVAVAISGNTVVVGARGGASYSDRGSATVFEYKEGNWMLRTRLAPSPVNEYGYFGTAVSVSGDIIAVGASRRTEKGSTYLYELNDNSWRLKAELKPESLRGWDGFGHALSLSGGNLVVGVYNSISYYPTGDIFFYGCSGAFSTPYIIPGQQFSLAEDASSAAQLGSITASTEALSNWKIVGGNKNSAFHLDAQGNLSVNAGENLDYETRPFYALTVQATDGQYTVYETVLVYLTNVAEGVVTNCVPAELPEDIKRPTGAGANFGRAVAIGDGLAVATALTDDGGKGAAYLYGYSGAEWVLLAKLQPQGGSGNEQFGASVAIQDSLIAVGAPQSADAGGSVYLFHYNGSDWVQLDRLTASDWTSTAYFGTAVAISGHRIAVGATNDDDLGQSSGSVYVFSRTGDKWQEEKIYPTDGGTRHYFGGAISMQGSTLAVGAIFAENGRGAAYIFRYNGKAWEQQQKLSAFDPRAGTFFGRSVSLWNNDVVVGADNALGSTRGSGAAYIYSFDGKSWMRNQKIYTVAGNSADAFGASIALQNNLIMVGNSSWSYPGSIDVFVREEDRWIEKGKIKAVAGVTGDAYGSNVSLYGPHIITGAWGVETNKGAAYLYKCAFEKNEQTPGEEAPVLSNQTFLIQENAPVATEVGTLTASASNPVTYSITAGNTNSAFEIDPISGIITVANAAALDYESTPSFSLTVNASVGNSSSEATITINLINSNDNVPVANCQPVSLNLEEGCSRIVAPEVFNNVSTDPDGNTLTYTISPSGPFTVGTTEVTLTVDDGTYTSNCTTTITIVDNIVPVASTTDLTLTLPANGTLTLTADQVNAGSIDNCEISSMSISTEYFSCADIGENAVMLTVTDGSGNTTTAQAIITIVDELAPVIAPSYQFSIDENVAAGTVLGNLQATDNCGRLSYFINAGNTAGAFSTTSSGQLQLAPNGVLDYEAVQEHNLLVEVNDDNGNFTTSQVTVTLNNLNDNAPQAGSSPLTAQETQEDAQYLFEVPADAFLDLDEGDQLVYSAPDLPAWLQFNAGSRTINGAPQNEQVGAHLIKIRATDRAAQFTEQEYVLTVTNTNDAPHSLLLQPVTVAENEPAESGAGTFSIEDADLNDVHTYSLVSGEGDVDNASFLVSGDQLLTATILNYEAKQVYTIRVRATDRAGAYIEEQFTITLADKTDARAFLPNLFSPNGDESNDRFILRAYQVQQVQLQIYNRQGKLVFQSSNVAEITEMGWDGTSSGVPQPAGTYVWKLQGNYADGSPINIEGKTLGNIVLVR